MTGVIATIPKFQFSSATGAPLALGTLTVYVAGSTTPTNTWQDQALSTLNTNPVQLDSRGECVLWLDSAVSYKFILKNAAGVIQWTVDDITSSALVNTLRADLSASSGSSLVGFLQAGSGAVATTVQTKLRETVSVADFGAVGNGTADDTAAIQAALDATPNYGTLEFVQGKNYKTTSAITIGVTRQNVTIQGNGARITAAHNGDGLVLISTNENYSAHSAFNLNIIGPNVQYPANAAQLLGTSTGAGIKIGRGGVDNNPSAYNCHFYNVNVAQFKIGYYLQNALLCKWFGGNINWNRYGIFVDSGQTNSNDFYGVSIRQNTYCGVYSEAHIATLSYPTNNRFFGGTFESNQPYQLDTGGWNTSLLTTGAGNGVLLQGGDQTWLFEGCYFEAHSYSIWLAGAVGCQFNNCYLNPGSGAATGGIRMDSLNLYNTFSQCQADAITGCPVDFNGTHATQVFNNFLNNGGFVFASIVLTTARTSSINIVNNRPNYQAIGTVVDGRPYTTMAELNNGLRTGRYQNGSIATATPTTMFSAALAGRYDIVCSAIANDGATYGSFATVVMDGTGRIVANNAALVAITLVGTDVKVTQTLGIAIGVKASWTFTPCES